MSEDKIVEINGKEYNYYELNDTQQKLIDTIVNWKNEMSEIKAEMDEIENEYILRVYAIQRANEILEKQLNGE